LARVEGTEGSDFAKHLRQETVNLSWGATLIIITSVETEALAQIIFLLKHSGFRITLILIQPASYVYPRADSQVQALGIPVFRVTREKDVEAWQPSI
jgi:hypothetical protein